jgi:hypothetical protein
MSRGQPVLLVVYTYLCYHWLNLPVEGFIGSLGVCVLISDMYVAMELIELISAHNSR